MPDRPAHEPDLNDLRESQSRRDHGMTRGPLRPAVPVGGVTVADDLATLRDYRPDDSRGFSQRRFDAALDRVEAEIARLRDGLRRVADYGHEMDDYDLPPKEARKIARALLPEDGAAECEHDYVAVANANGYECDKCGRASVDGINPRGGAA